MNDRRWPWLILVPQRADLSEIHDLTPLDQTMLTFEAGHGGAGAENGDRLPEDQHRALGNIVRQLHLHVIARNEGDAGWPGPVWGHGTRETYEEKDARKLIADIRAAL
ncbi:MAG: HIT family protein [Candidatus Ochrobactrum gambitense]|nr:MAG: HIT family protein [Candidatus Ochrobactrum gambitense]